MRRLSVHNTLTSHNYWTDHPMYNYILELMHFHVSIMLGHVMHFVHHERILYSLLLLLLLLLLLPLLILLLPLLISLLLLLLLLRILLCTSYNVNYTQRHSLVTANSQLAVKDQYEQCGAAENATLVSIYHKALQSSNAKSLYWSWRFVHTMIMRPKPTTLVSINHNERD